MDTDFKDIIDLASVGSLIESLSQATGNPVTLLDHQGEVLVSTGWQRACAIFHRQHLKTVERCRDSDRYFARFLEKHDRPADGYVRHTCKNGLIEVGLPIVIDDVQFATLLFGQFLPDPPDTDRYRRQARACGLEQEAYLEAIAGVPVYDQQRVDELLRVYSGVVELLIRLGQTHLEEIAARRELKHSEQKFRELFDSSGDAIYIVDLDGQILEVNRVACERLGYSREELRSMHISQLNDPQYVPAIKERLARFRNNERFIFETVHLHRNGEPIPVEINGRPIDFAGRKAIMSTARDLRERNDAFQALQQSEGRFRSIVNSSPMGMFLYYLDPQDRLIFTGTNPAADKILGIDNSRFIGKTIEEAFPKLAETEIPERFRDICRTGRGWHSEQVFYDDDNVSGIFEVYGFRTTARTMAIYFQDITERKKAEQTLRESEEKYRLLFTAEKDAIVIFDIADLSIVEMNDAALDMYGYDREAFLGLKAIDLSAEPEMSRERISEVLAGRLKLMEARHRRQDGTVFPVEITAGMFEWQDRNMLVAIIRDISERERITRMKDDMLSSISHEMRTPLTAILGFTELLLHEQMDPEKSLQFLQLSYQEGERLRELIDDLLDLQRLRAGFTGHRFAPVQIKPVLLEITNLFAEANPEHSFRVDCPDRMPEVTLDEQKMHRALKNLISNAVKYSPGGGPVALTARHLKKRGVISIAVSDQGLGIPPEDQEQLFERFYRVYHPEVGNIGGTGLGLALVKEIVKMHDGIISVQSEPGKGSVFTMELPIAGPARRT